jgi:hypothetical protein
MWIRTQSLLNRFSSDNKKQKAVLPGTAHWASAFGENDLTTAVATRASLPERLKYSASEYFDRDL